MIIYHNCPEGQTKIIKENAFEGKEGGIVDFETDGEGNTTAKCRSCGRAFTGSEMPQIMPINGLQLSPNEQFELWDAILWLLEQPTDYDDDEGRIVLDRIRQKLANMCENKKRD